MPLPPRPIGWTPDTTATGPYRLCGDCGGAGWIIEMTDPCDGLVRSWAVPVVCDRCNGKGWG